MNSESPGNSYLTDWEKCFLCQQVKSEPLLCPAKSKRETSGYETIVKNLKEFQQLGQIPLNVR